MKKKIIVNVEGLAIEEKQSVNEALAKIKGIRKCDPMYWDKVITLHGASLDGVNVGFVYYKGAKPTHTYQQVLEMAGKSPMKKGDVDTWQPIKTAPKDIDVLVEHGGYVFVARYVPAKTLLASNGYDGWSEYDETEDEYYCPAGWYQHTDCECCEHNYSFLSGSPTHWMALPKPPFDQSN